MAFPTINNTDQNLQLVQANINTALQASQNNPFNNSSILTGISLTASQDNLVPHKLGRSLQFWILANQNTNAVIWSPISTSLSGKSSNSQFVNLWCSSGCTVSLVVG